MTIWDVLGLAPDAEREAIRRAYARKLRVTNPEDDPEGFKVLREAYERALAEVDWRTSWAEYEDDDRNGADEATADLSHETRTPARDWDTASRAEPGDASEPVSAVPTRDADLAALRGRMAALEGGLRGPWRASDAELDWLLRALLSAEAMGELGVRDDVESWLAELIADTVPASDAILRQSVDAFGWDERAVHHFAVHRVLARLEEWRMIAALGDPYHDHHAGWRSLTGTPGNALFWRIDAFQPSVARGAAALLGDVGEDWPGLRHSFNPASVKRWTAYFARPRLTLGMLLQVPIVLAALCWSVFALTGEAASPIGIGLAACLALAAPAVTLFALAPLRQRWRDGALWWRMRHYWLPAYGATLVLAGLLPGDWPVAIALPALGIAIWAFLARDLDIQGKPRIGAVATFGAIAVFMTMAVSDILTPAQGVALAIAATLYLYLRFYQRDAAAAIVGTYLGERREWWLLFLTIAVLALGIVIVVLRDSWAPVIAFYPVALCILALVLPVGVAAPGHGPPRGIAMTILVVAFLSAGVASMPDATTPPAGLNGDVPLADGDTTGRTVEDVMFGSGTATRALTAMERAQPGLAGVRTGDPVLYAELRAELNKFYDGQATREEAAAAYAARIDTAYRAKLPDADAGALMETQRIRIAVLRALRKTDVAACANEGDKAYDAALLPSALRKRHNAQIYNVIGNPSIPVELQGDATPLSNRTLLARAAAALGQDDAAVSTALSGKSAPGARCDARIALLEAMVEMPQAEVVAMLRRELRRGDGR